MRREECPHQKIRDIFLWKRCEIIVSKEKGQVEIAAGIFFLLFLAILFCAMFQMDLFRAAAQYAEDALAASNLASAVIDIEEYGISHRLQISDPEEAFERYKTALKGNLNLDDGFYCANRHLISGPVRILKYIIYNCREDGILVYHIDEQGVLTSWQGASGGMRAPNGTLIESTSIYSEIAFPVEGFLGVSTEAKKGMLVDIVLNGEN